jgi:hypothetical protein
MLVQESLSNFFYVLKVDPYRYRYGTVNYLNVWFPVLNFRMSHSYHYSMIKIIAYVVYYWMPQLYILF